MNRVDDLVAYYENLSEGSVDDLARFYAPDAYFKDPFNEVRGVEAIGRILRHMFRQVDGPRFAVRERVVADNGVMLTWEFTFRFRQWRPHTVQRVRGASHLRFDGEGRVAYHRDYWDAAEEMYAKLPLIGWIARRLQRALQA